jgi:hypothetical protein
VTWILAAVYLAGAVLVALMFAIEFPYNSPIEFGRMSDQVLVVSSTLIAIVVPWLSARAARTILARLGIGVVVLASLAAAASGYLLVEGRLRFLTSTAISVSALLIQYLWMLWLCRLLRRDPAFPPGTARFGILLPVAAFAGTALYALALLLPSDSWMALLGIVPAIVLGAVAWALTPVWFALMGMHVWRGPRTVTDPT